MVLREGLVAHGLVIHDLPKSLRLGCVLRGLLGQLTLIRLCLRFVVEARLSRCLFCLLLLACEVELCGLLLLCKVLCSGSVGEFLGLLTHAELL